MGRDVQQLITPFSRRALALGMMAACFGLGRLNGYFLGKDKGISESRSLAEPTKVYYQDIDGDGQTDILVRNRAGETSIFLQRYDLGGFQKLENAVREEQGLYESKINQIRKAAEQATMERGGK